MGQAKKEAVLQILSDQLIEIIKQLSQILRDDDSRLSKLSKTELAVVSLIRRGLTTDQIAMRLFVSPLTTKTHRRNIRRKLELQDSGINLQTYLRSELY
ncbi:hypothetical protein ES702_07191 [subsurface metagenome]